MDLESQLGLGQLEKPRGTLMLGTREGQIGPRPPRSQHWGWTRGEASCLCPPGKQASPTLSWESSSLPSTMLLSLKQSQYLWGSQHCPDAEGFWGLLHLHSPYPNPSPLPNLTPYSPTQATVCQFGEYLSKHFVFFYEITYICVSVFR